MTSTERVKLVCIYCKYFRTVCSTARYRSMNKLVPIRELHSKLWRRPLSPVASSITSSLLNVPQIKRFTNISDSISTGFHPCEAGGNETVSTLFLDNEATCDDKFFKVFDDPEALLTAKNGSFLIMVSLRTLGMLVFRSALLGAM